MTQSAFRRSMFHHNFPKVALTLARNFCAFVAIAIANCCFASSLAAQTTPSSRAPKSSQLPVISNRLIPIRPEANSQGARILDFVPGTSSSNAVVDPMRRTHFENAKWQEDSRGTDAGAAEQPAGQATGQLPQQVEEFSLEDDSKSEDHSDQQPQRKRVLETSGRIEIVRQHYPDGRVQLEREVTQDIEGNYLNHGAWRLFGPTGQILADGVFQFGLMEGPWSRWHPATPTGIFTLKPFNLFRGPFLSTATFAEGQLDGVWSINDASQRKIMEISYRNGKRHGLSAWYYPNSGKMREQYFTDGLLDGPLIEWDERGRETRREEFVNGQRVHTDTTFYRPQQKRTLTNYLDGRLELTSNDDWWDATPAAYETIGTRVQHGPASTWYENGQPQMEGQFVNGNRDGQWTWWHLNGQKQLAGTYAVGKKTGMWTWWHANGMKAVEGNFENDSPAGVWTWWDETGRRTNSQNFIHVDGTDDAPVVDESEQTPILPENDNDTIDPPITDSDGNEIEIIEPEISPQIDPKSGGT